MQLEERSSNIIKIVAQHKYW